MSKTNLFDAGLKHSQTASTTVRKVRQEPLMYALIKGALLTANVFYFIFGIILGPYFSEWLLTRALYFSFGATIVVCVSVVSVLASLVVPLIKTAHCFWLERSHLEISISPEQKLTAVLALNFIKKKIGKCLRKSWWFLGNQYVCNIGNLMG